MERVKLEGEFLLERLFDECSLKEGGEIGRFGPSAERKSRAGV